MSKELDTLVHLYTKLSCKSNIPELKENLKEFEIVETALKDREEYVSLYNKYYHAYIKLREKKSKKEQALDIIKENLNIDEILLAVKGVCKASDYDLVKEALL